MKILTFRKAMPRASAFGRPAMAASVEPDMPDSQSLVDEPRSGRLPEAKCRAFLCNIEGMAAVEFGIVAMPFFAIILAVLQVGVVVFAQQELETGVEQAARLVLTGQVQQQGLTQAQFQTQVCANLPVLFKCANVMIDLQSVAGFVNANTSTPVLTYNAQGNITNVWAFSPGAPGTIEVLRVMYRWPTFLVPLYLKTRQSAQRIAAAHGDCGLPERAVLMTNPKLANSRGFIREESAFAAVDVRDDLSGCFGAVCRLGRCQRRRRHQSESNNYRPHDHRSRVAKRQRIDGVRHHDVERRSGNRGALFCDKHDYHGVRGHDRCFGQCDGDVESFVEWLAVDCRAVCPVADRHRQGQCVSHLGAGPLQLLPHSICAVHREHYVIEPNLSKSATFKLDTSDAIEGVATDEGAFKAPPGWRLS